MTEVPQSNSPPTPRDIVEEFLEENARVWESFNDQDCDGHVLVDVTHDDLKYTQYHCVIANYIAKEQGLEPVYLTGSSSELQRRICTSYYPGEFVSLSRSGMSPGTKLAGVRRFLRSLASVHLDVDELISLAADGVQIGDLVYNTTLRNTGRGSLDSITPAVARNLISGSLLYHHARRLFEEFNIRAFVVSHFFYNRCGIPARVALDEDVTVYVVKTGATTRVYRSLEESQIVPQRPSANLVQRIETDHREFAFNRVGNIMKNRIGIHPDAFWHGSLSNTDSGEQVSRCVDDSLPTILILPHVFVEPLRQRQKLFRDYLVWLRETLAFARETRDRNWLIKPHPDRNKYDQQPTTQELFQQIIGGTTSNTVTYLDESIDHSDLIPAVDAVLTVDGTAGMEYACYGIPPILSSFSHYSGFDFTYQPDSPQEYFELLSSIKKGSVLSDNKRHRAMIVSFIHFYLMTLHPEVIGDYDRIQQDDEVGKWHLATETIRGTQPEEDSYYQLIAEMLENDATNLVNVIDISGLAPSVDGGDPSITRDI